MSSSTTLSNKFTLHWINKILRSKSKKMKKFLKKSNSETQNFDDIPQDWQNTLVKKCPTLQRASASTTSFASSSSSSSSSNSVSYSVTDFLRDLANDEYLYTSSGQNRTKTSTPRAVSSRILETNLDLSGLKIYEVENIKDQEDSVGDVVYENGEFLRSFEEELQEIVDEHDIDDGYEIIVVNNNLNR